MTEPTVKIEICDKCHEKFKRRWNYARRSWSQLNDVTYWTRGKTWNDYKVLCRSCLKDIFKNQEAFRNLIDMGRKSTLKSQIYTGLMDKDDKIREQKEK